jgi:hypothetical protein
MEFTGAEKSVPRYSGEASNPSVFKTKDKEGFFAQVRRSE